MAKKIILTVGVTAHNEGMLAHKTLKSIFRALELVEEHNIPYEIIIHIDNGDEPTVNYFKQYQNDKRFTIINSTFGDLGMSRNCIASHAKGEFLAFLDADDMISKNWYVNGIKRIAESKKEIMVHPNIQFNFGAGTKLEYTIRKDSFDKFEDAIISAGVNRWCSAIMGRTQTFLSFPYMKTEKGYGYEDYFLNTKTVGAGIKHMVAPETVMFYRQKREGSLLTSSNAEHVMQPYVELLDIDFIKTSKTVDKKSYQQHIEPSHKKRAILRVYKKIRSNNVFNYFITPIAKVAKKVLSGLISSKNVNQKIPQFLLEEWKEINSIESQLYPTAEAKAEITCVEADNYDVGLAYYEIAQKIPKLPDYIFIVPWVATGGADKVLINYLKFFQQEHPNWTIAVIATEPSANTWSSKLPDNAYIIDFGNAAQGLWDTQKEILFSRIITQLKCFKLHIINSLYGYEWARMHKKFIATQCKLNVSIFSIDNQYTAGVGDYSNPYLFDIYNCVDHIFTDNQAVINEMHEKHGFDMSKMSAHYQPIETTKSEVRCVAADGPTKILWASRIAHEKAPEILCDIAKRLDNKQFIIDVYGEFSRAYNEKLFRNISCINYKGSFEGLDTIDTSAYDLFLYTSLRDGLPNILLEAIAANLPVVAPAVGGIPELIKDRKTGILVGEPLDVSGYIESIKEAAKNKAFLQHYAQNAQKLIETRHSWDNFAESIKKDFYD